MTGQRILVVDDSPSMRQLIIDTLERAGYEPVEAVDGADGLARARDEGPIDLALVDFNMPRLDGLAVIRGLRAGEGGGVCLAPDARDLGRRFNLGAHRDVSFGCSLFGTGTDPEHPMSY